MALILLLFVAAIASAQVRIQPSFRPNRPIAITITPDARPVTAITGLPYSGDRTSEHILSDGTHMQQSIVREYRDSLGRKRQEHSGQGFGSLTIVEILDPVAGFDWVLDPANQVAYRVVLHATSRAGSLNLQPCDPGGPATTQSQPLGSQTLQGIEACGRRTVIAPKDGSPGLTAENWFSREDVGGVMLSTTSDLQGGHNIAQLVNVKFSEPDPALFVPPAGYRVVDETTAFTITGPVPAAPAPQTPVSRTVVALTGMPWSGDLMSGSTLLSRQYRDSMGRTRWDQLANNGTTSIVVDSVAGYSYTLDSATHTAHRRNVTVQSNPASEATAPATASPQTATLPSGVIGLTESLGTKTVNGVATYGTRVTLTYPPGTASGNDKTTATVNASWFSPQLGASLQTQSSGALVPNSTTVLANLKYSEPDPSLFKVPDGYQVIDDPQL